MSGAAGRPGGGRWPTWVTPARLLLALLALSVAAFAAGASAGVTRLAGSITAAGGLAGERATLTAPGAARVRLTAGAFEIDVATGNALSGLWSALPLSSLWRSGRPSVNGVSARDVTVTGPSGPVPLRSPATSGSVDMGTSGPGQERFGLPVATFDAPVAGTYLVAVAGGRAGTHVAVSADPFPDEASLWPVQLGFAGFAGMLLAIVLLILERDRRRPAGGAPGGGPPVAGSGPGAPPAGAGWGPPAPPPGA